MKFDEKHTVQEPIIKYVSITNIKVEALSSCGWKYIEPEEIAKYRKSNTSIVLENILVPKLIAFNPFLTEESANEIVKKLERLHPGIEGNFNAWEYLKGLKSVYIPKDKQNRNICLIDTNNIEKNEFHVTKEFEFTNGVKTIRQDIVFFINGIPVVFIEAKAPYVIEGMEIAFEQIMRYHRYCPELLSVEQIFVLTHIIQFLYGATWNNSKKNLYNWKDEKAGNFEELVKSFFSKDRIVKFVTDYILFTKKDDQLQKVVLRPHQMRAVEKITHRAKEGEKRRGLVWHTQGSGKTYTMIVTAQKLIENPLFENPTVIMLVDRNELESQLFSNIKAVGIENVEIAQSKEHLRKLLKSDKRGLIISMIHKFEGIEANINRRKNIFVLIDEAHRTTSGDLGNYLMGALPNAMFIGFTGTPIDKTSYGKSTFEIFGKDDPPQGYLDKYSIAESIEEGTTVPLHYTLAPNEFTIDKDLLEREFFDLKEAEGISEVEELNKILEKSVNLKNILKSRNRIDKIANYISTHFKEYVEPLGYKAFIVAVDREACSIYKQELDKYLPEDYSKVVYSPYHNDPEHMVKYHISEEEEKRIRKDFLDPEKKPKILIVTSKLLTGFDAPVLYCMYLDKPMRDHVLLQTIARVNRPYEDKDGRKKPAGFIVDFIGIFDNLQKALAFDSADLVGIVNNVDEQKERFVKLINLEDQEFIEFREFFTTLGEKETQDKKLEWILEYFFEKEKRQKFYKYFKELSKIYNIISPDDFLRPYLEQMDTLARVYKILCEAFEPSIKVDREFSKKIKKLVQERVKQSEIGEANEIFEINENTLKKLEESKKSEIVKVFSLYKSLLAYIEKELHVSPFLISIKERIENLMKIYREKQITTKEVLEKLKQETVEINVSTHEQAKTGLDKETYSIYWFLKQQGVANSQKYAKEIKNLILKYPHWKVSEQQTRKLKQEIVKVLRTNFDIETLVKKIDELLNILGSDELHH